MLWKLGKIFRLACFISSLAIIFSFCMFLLFSIRGGGITFFCLPIVYCDSSYSHFSFCSHLQGFKRFWGWVHRFLYLYNNVDHLQQMVLTAAVHAQKWNHVKLAACLTVRAAPGMEGTKLCGSKSFLHWSFSLLWNILSLFCDGLLGSTGKTCETAGLENSFLVKRGNGGKEINLMIPLWET